MYYFELKNVIRCSSAPEEDWEDVLFCPTCNLPDFFVIVVRDHVHFQCVHCDLAICSQPSCNYYPRAQRLKNIAQRRERRKARAKGD
jgi:hypothetical protein